MWLKYTMSNVFLVLCALLCFLNSVTSIPKKFLSENYVPYIIEIYRYYKASSVFLFHTTAIGDLKFGTMIKTWVYSLSREKIPVIGINLSYIHQTSSYRYKIGRPLFVMVLFNDESVLEFSRISQTLHMSFPIWYVIFLPGNYRRDYCHEKAGNLFNVRFDTEMLVMCPPDRIIREWYCLRDDKTETFDLATWKSNGVVTFLTDLTLYERRNNMNGLTLRTVIVEDGPFVSVDKNGRMKGIFGDVINEISHIANFTLSFVKQVKEYGSLDEEKKIWSGAVGEIVAGRADISISEFSLTSSRISFIDFTFPILVTSVRFYIKDPTYSGVKWDSYFRIFDSRIWLAIIFIIITASFLVTLLNLNELRERKTDWIISVIAKNYLQIWGIFCQQGLVEFPYRFPLKLAYFSIFLSATIVSSAYSGALVSYLANTIRILPFQSFEELVYDGTYKLIVYRNSAEYDMFANSNDALSKKIMTMIKNKEELPLTTLEGISQVCNEKKVTFLTSAQISLSLSNYTLCKMITIKSGQIGTLGMILTKNSPFTQLISHHMKSLFYNGAINRFIRRNTRKMTEDEFIYKTVSYDGVKPIFTFLEIGFGISIFILIMEKLYSYQKKYLSEKKHVHFIKNVEYSVKR